ncbi:MAG TPA: 1,4-alpha-glucan branching protein domain-containing protein [Planctomycetota bacterium]|jgi:1,4-alpha-glucan branching enzyme
MANGSTPKGYLTLVLHAHLPFVRHPEHPEFLEEDWLYEAMTETYIPLLLMLEGFERDKVPACFTMSLTPPLCEMLADKLLQDRYSAKLAKLQALSEQEIKRTQDTPFAAAAADYQQRFARCRTLFDKWERNLVTAFKHYQEEGFLEIITCGATHGFLPLMASESSIRAQIQVAVVNYRKHFGRSPKGIWLPECAYAPGIDKYLREAGIQFFFIDTHGLAYGTPRPRYGQFRPIFCPSGVAAFARDAESSKQVWSSEEGYPGDADYREFYRDLGYDADYAYIKPFLHSDGVRRNTGIKYHRITGRVSLGEKQPYNPGAAKEKAASHAGNFMFNRQHQANWLNGVLGVEPCIVAPYDAELFGHWWYEGPMFLDFLMRKICFDQDEIALTTPSRFLDRFRTHQVLEPSASSWGDKGYFEVWLNGSNDWIYRHLHASEMRMRELVRRFANPTGLQERALKQAARELLLAQSSDWAFIMTTGTMVAYAEKRTRDHLHRFNGLYLQLVENRIEEPWLRELESKDNIFSELDARVYA